MVPKSSDPLVRQGRVLFRWRNFLPLPAFSYVLGLQHWGPDYSASAVTLLRWACIALALVGFSIRAIVIGRLPPGSSSRSTREMSAPVLNSTGLYSVVRHPLYLGNLFLWLAVAVLGGHPEGVVFALAVFWLSYDRVAQAEEAFLSQTFGARYEAWAERTPRFVPRLAGYRPMPGAFSLKAVLLREIHTACLLVPLCVLVEFTRAHASTSGGRHSGWLLLTAAAAGVALGGAADYLRRR
jgi:protein-S-isoprenylcysteine O-methyltransferase Ste14